MLERVAVTADQGLEKSAMWAPTIQKKNSRQGIIGDDLRSVLRDSPSTSQWNIYKRHGRHQCRNRILLLGCRVEFIIKKQNNKWWCLFCRGYCHGRARRLGNLQVAAKCTERQGVQSV